VVGYNEIFLEPPDRSKKGMHAEDKIHCVEFKGVTSETAVGTRWSEEFDPDLRAAARF
jgi:hypothetical protein